MSQVRVLLQESEQGPQDLAGSRLRLRGKPPEKPGLFRREVGLYHSLLIVPFASGVGLLVGAVKGSKTRIVVSHDGSHSRE